MKLFSWLYDKTLSWSGHAHAPYYLAGVSFAESSFFPVPPDVMLISMGLAAPEKSWRYAFITTLFSTLGGVFGYLIGYYGIEFVQTWLISSSFHDSYFHVMQWFKTYGIWIIFLAGFSPVPYKLFTIAAGALHMAFLPFLIASFIGRGLRFFLVSSILFYMGERLKTELRRYIDRIGWSLLAIVVAVFFLVKWVI
ncbi:YqaA family protein [Legionella spiritensis]|uniref:Putative membrane protein n=1 Tax=Legionella spiritensis TaxID=452 RepID=A0A0W0Z8M2_LEGSP|nr:YqaA family protein [Legionella spiritensis]KTD65460.1 putative membrane protein [Legionella spiritensis]SNV35763.1 SNARE associated Golgi protein [Legionella spiritensis]